MFRRSKVRNLYGTPLKKDFWYENIKITSAPEADSTKANSSYIGVILETASGSVHVQISGGCFTVIDNLRTGRLTDLPTFTGHSSYITDLEFNPFNDNIIATASDDATVMLWEIPEDGPCYAVKTPRAQLAHHTKKVTSISFHPAASNCLTSVSADLDIVVWDLVKLKPRNVISYHQDIIHALCWNYNGSLIVTTSRDKKIRVIDVRSKEIVSETLGHTGTKSSRQVWLGDSDHFITTGFSRMGERQVFAWDFRALKSPINEVSVASGSGVLLPFYDPDINVLYIAAKGDGSIDYYEWCDNSNLSYISSYKSANPLRDLCFYPKSYCDVEETEVARVLQVHSNHLEPLSLRIPRRTKAFYPSIYKDTTCNEPAMTVDQFFDGQNADPVKISFKTLLEAKRNKESDSQSKYTPHSYPKSTTTTLPSDPQIDILHNVTKKDVHAVKAVCRSDTSYRRSLEDRVSELESTNKLLYDKIETLQREIASLR